MLETLLGAVELPLWLLLGLIFWALAGVIHYLIYPLIHWLYHQRTLHTYHLLDEKLAHGLRPQTLSNRLAWIERLLSDPPVVAAISQDAEQSGKPFKKSWHKARRYAFEMVPSFNLLLYFRVGYWLARGFLRFLYRIQVGYSAESAYDRIDKQACVVLVSNHRSNFDPLFLIYLASKRSSISFSAGEWARGWPFKQILHAIGFYIIRRDSGNPLYRKLLERYVYTAVSNCVPQGLFIEGGLSRDGKMQPLKLGMLNYVIKAMGHEECRDIVFIPSALNYDKIPEDKTLLAHQNGGFKEKNRFYSLWSFLQFFAQLSVHLLPHRHKPFGYACVNFGEPISLRRWLNDQGIDDLAQLSKEARIAVINQLGEQLASEIKKQIPVLPVSVLAGIFLQDMQRARSSLEIKVAANQMLHCLKQQGAYLLLPEGDLDQAIAQGLYTLRKRGMLVRNAAGLYLPMVGYQKMFEYYYNSLPESVRDDCGA